MQSPGWMMARIASSLKHAHRIIAATLAFLIMLPTIALNVGAAMAVSPATVPDEYVMAQDEALAV